MNAGETARSWMDSIQVRNPYLAPLGEELADNG
jgi:hypothetical protein